MKRFEHLGLALCVALGGGHAPLPDLRRNTVQLLTAGLNRPLLAGTAVFYIERVIFGTEKTSIALGSDTYGVAGLARACPQIDCLGAVARCVIRGADVIVMARNTGIVDPFRAAVIVDRKLAGVPWAMGAVNWHRVSVRRLDGTASAGMDERRGGGGRGNSSDGWPADQAEYRKYDKRTEWLHGS